MARITDYDFDICKDICNKITEGFNIKKVLESNEDYPSFPTWCKWKRENIELLNLYVNAIQDKAESVDALIDDIFEDLRNGMLEPSAANVLIQTLKWKASKYYPKMFGDRTDITTNGKDVVSNIDYGKLSNEALMEIANATIKPE